MNGYFPHKARPPRSSRMRTARLAAASLVVVAMAAPACLSRPIEPLDPRTTSTVSERTTSAVVDKIDLLLAIDNSASMNDKQQILKDAVPDLVNRLVNPLCLTPEGAAVALVDTPTGPDCPAGSEREFKPITDIHIGIVSSSLGDYGANMKCPDVQSTSLCANNTSLNDRGHLITRMDPCGSGETPTYQNLGFLAWDPTQKMDPKGEGNKDNLIASVSDLVVGTGQVGCGFEAQNESWYRFLVDPDPYNSITFDGTRATLHDVDTDLLGQRKDFLRPNSLLAIIVLTDENDCSGMVGGANILPFLTDGQFTLMPKASAKCAEDPNDECCTPCSKYPSSCPAEPACTLIAKTAPEDDNINLRCFDQKRRFGRDYLYPASRYVTGLTADQVPGRDGKPKPNPLFSDLNPDDDNSAIRGKGLVFLAGVVGVPWQDIQRTEDAEGNPIPDNTLQFKTVDEMTKDGTWDKILGDPSKYVAPTDPHMIESVGPRAGLPDQNTPDDQFDPIHGHEWDTLGGDLQFACIFDLPESAYREDNSGNAGDCKGNSPLCTTNPADPTKNNLQVRAKAYPGTRHLSILRGLGQQGIVASVCPKQLDDRDRSDYGYRPAVAAIIDRLKTQLNGQCLPRALTATNGRVDSCIVIEAGKTAGGAACDCNVPGRTPVPDANKEAITAAKADPTYETAQWDCFCAIPQVGEVSADASAQVKAAKAAELDQCQNVLSTEDQTGNGWCYIDTDAGVGDNEELVEKCPEASKRKLRFVGAGESTGGNVTFITCSGD